MCSTDVAGLLPAAVDSFAPSSCICLVLLEQILDREFLYVELVFIVFLAFHSTMTKLLVCSMFVCVFL